MNDHTEVIRAAFRAVEERDEQALLALYHPEIEFHWPPSLPYGGTLRGAEVPRAGENKSWTATWDPFQPTDAERRMDPRIVAAGEDEVVVLWRQRAMAPSGDLLDEPVLGLYRLRDGKLVRAQMFHFDTAALLEFLRRAAEV